MTYRPNPESLASRVLGFFALNPDEELTLQDIVAKFVEPGDSRNIHGQLMIACDNDMLIYDPSGDVYRKGPVGLPQVQERAEQPAKPGRPPAPAPHPTKVVATAKAQETRAMTTKRPKATFLDLSKVTIESGIPVPEPGQEWREFLSRFKVGDSAALPSQYLIKLRAAIKAAKAAGHGVFTTKSIAEGAVRVWRTA